MSNVEVTVLKGFGREAALRRRWLNMWKQVRDRIFLLPPWMQDMLLEDISTAIKNRIAIMEKSASGRHD